MAVLIITGTFLVCPGMVGDVVCGFRICCMLSDASLRTCWLVSVGSERGIILLVRFSEKHGLGLRPSTENASVTRRVAGPGFPGLVQVNACFPEKSLIVATFMFKCVSI